MRINQRLPLSHVGPANLRLDGHLRRDVPLFDFVVDVMEIVA